MKLLQGLRKRFRKFIQEVLKGNTKAEGTKASTAFFNDDDTFMFI